MIWILDGYNLIHKIPALEKALDRSLEQGRNALISMCENLQKKRGDFPKIFIVFDGNSAFRDLPPYKTARLEVIFTETSEDADDRIIELLETRFDGKLIGIVSDDNYVMNHAREFKAKRMSVADFYAYSTKLQSKTITEKQKIISNKVAQDITKEYSQYLGIK